MQRAPPAAHRRRVGLVRCVGEGRPLHIADGSVSCVPCARVCVMVVHVHDALVEIQSLVRRKPCLVLYLFLTKHFIFISGFIFISFLFIADTGRYEPVGRMPAAIVGRLICIQCPCASHGLVSSED